MRPSKIAWGFSCGAGRAIEEPYTAWLFAGLMTSLKPNLIAIAADAGFFPAAAFLADRLARLNPRDDTDIVLFSEDAAELEKARAFGVPAETRNIALSADLPAKPATRITRATYARLFIPAIVGRDVRRILYLDADIYPESDALFRLFDLDMGDHTIAAARDLFFAYCAKMRGTELAKARVPPDQYLNAGVLLIDRERFVESRLGEKVARLAERQRIDDQAAINRILAGDWLELSPAMNMAVRIRSTFVAEVVAPVVTHFIGPVKPWSGPAFQITHQARPELEAYVLRSPWRDFLSKHYSFQMAWDTLQARQGGPTHAKPPKRTIFDLPKGADVAGVIDCLKTADFADVQQGITTMNLAFLDRPQTKAIAATRSGHP